MSKKPCSISFKSAGNDIPCTTVINGKLVVKGDAVFNKNVTTKKDLNVNNVLFNYETIDESGQEVSPTKSISFINTNGVGELDDACCDGFYKKIVKINDGTTASEWETLSDINGTVRVVVFDEFNNDEGPYIGGDFTSVNGNTALKYLAKYDVSSSSWTSVKPGGDNIFVGGFGEIINAIIFGPSGDGPYIGGSFTSVDNDSSLKYLAKYDSSSTSWTSVKSGGDGIERIVEAIAFHPSGDGPYIGGNFGSVDGDGTLRFLARYHSSSDSWTSVKSGGDGIDDVVQAIAFHPITGEGPYIGGDSFFTIDFDAYGLAKWDSGSSSWTSINPSGDFPVPTGNPIYSIAFKQNGEGPYIGGGEFLIGAAGINNLAYWNGSSWTSVKTGGDNITKGPGDGVFSIAFGPSDDGSYIGGSFESVDGNPILSSFAKYDSTSNSWTSVKSGGDDIIDPALAIVNSISFSPSGTGPYIGGKFTEVGGETANANFAYWQDEQVYKLTYNDTETLTLTNKGDNATLIYNSDPTAGWVKIV